MSDSSFGSWTGTCLWGAPGLLHGLAALCRIRVVDPPLAPPQRMRVDTAFASANPHLLLVLTNGHGAIAAETFYILMEPGHDVLVVDTSNGRVFIHADRALLRATGPKLDTLVEQAQRLLAEGQLADALVLCIDSWPRDGAV